MLFTVSEVFVQNPSGMLSITIVLPGLGEYSSYSLSFPCWNQDLASDKSFARVGSLFQSSSLKA